MGSDSNKGSEVCSRYYGRGYILCTYCSSTGRKNCSSCDGSGKGPGFGLDSPTCYNCSSIGRTSCYSCGGSGTSYCYSCGGSGKQSFRWNLNYFLMKYVYHVMVFNKKDSLIYFNPLLGKFYYYKYHIQIYGEFLFFKIYDRWTSFLTSFKHFTSYIFSS